MATSDKPASIITDRDIERFSEGDCHVLANALSKITGWAIAAFTSPHSSGPCFHVFCLREDGVPIDIRGAQTDIEEFKQYWWADDYKEFTMEQILTDWKRASDEDNPWQHPVFGHYSFKRARQVALLLASEHQL